MGGNRALAGGCRCCRERVVSQAAFGYRVYTEKAIEMAGESAGSTPNGHRRAVRTAAPGAAENAEEKAGEARWD
jgi:hypothetical protein